MIAPVSAVPAATLLFCTAIWNEPAATVVIATMVPPEFDPERIDATTVSPTATDVSVTVNFAVASAARLVVSVVIAPEFPVQDTPVVLLVICVTAHPAPVAYPNEADGELVVINPVAATLVGVKTPRVNVAAGVLVEFATVADTPLAVTTEKLVTVPVPFPILGL